MELGIFGDIREHPETGDLNGIEIEFSGDKRREIATTLCEGWCHWIYRTGYVMQGGIIRYSLREELTDQDGRKSFNTISIMLKPAGGTWLVKVADARGWSKLRRLSKPFGLAIARSSMLKTNAR